MSIRLKSSAGTREIPLVSDLYKITQNQLLNTNLGEFYTPGIYWMSAPNADPVPNVSDRPVETMGCLIVLKLSYTIRAQIFVSATDHLYIRHGTNGGSYSSWRKITSEAL